VTTAISTNPCAIALPRRRGTSSHTGRLSVNVRPTKEPTPANDIPPSLRLLKTAVNAPPVPLATPLTCRIPAQGHDGKQPEKQWRSRTTPSRKTSQNAVNREKGHHVTIWAPPLKRKEKTSRYPHHARCLKHGGGADPARDARQTRRWPRHVAARAGGGHATEPQTAPDWRQRARPTAPRPCGGGGGERCRRGCCRLRRGRGMTVASATAGGGAVRPRVGSTEGAVSMPCLSVVLCPFAPRLGSVGTAARRAHRWAVLSSGATRAQLSALQRAALRWAIATARRSWTTTTPQRH